MLFHHRVRMARAGVLLSLILTGCADTGTPTADLPLDSLEGDTYFIRQPERPRSVMDALFQGRVVRDERGCLRLQPPADATVVWPFGSTLEARSSGQWVVEAGGNEMGKIGGLFSFGGGEVPFLHVGLGFQQPDITQIQTRCPGRFWIVGDVLSP